MKDNEVQAKETQAEGKAIVKADPDKIIRHHIYGSMGIGLIPIPLVDLAALTAVQLNMLRKLAGIYDVPFFKGKVRDLIASLVASGVAGGVPVLTAGSLATLVKTIPIVGQTAGVVTMPIIAGAMTYAVGKVFLQHFASGGTFLTFNPEKVKAYYAEMFKEGSKVASAMK